MFFQANRLRTSGTGEPPRDEFPVAFVCLFFPCFLYIPARVVGKAATHKPIGVVNQSLPNACSLYP